jgi:hypothetical protein
MIERLDNALNAFRPLCWWFGWVVFGAALVLIAGAARASVVEIAAFVLELVATVGFVVAFVRLWVAIWR